ncbi:glycosyltransferase family 4 protein [Runella slithyformis]|uniref:Glycosyl transferase group 1 n=1 Tax=Runella slithyformis (strain ATCC 29530 / DSM 19594 / LMG 11500 / NCIMB 11436 / LSU 4) TaxID=761193 RepID=A0A7U3ZNA0_RUNSL|nr:glycosyltransferase family 4 protein [Runella slithyformis]AEI50297.1 glycosyl transferase group 1 [Runella slithyformis DSM 19594]
MKKKQNKIIFVGLLPPIITGQSVATAAILDHLRKHTNYVKVIRLPDNLTPKSSVQKILKWWQFILVNLRFLWAAGWSSKIVYLSGARSFMGTLRNLPMIAWSRWRHQRIIMHYHCGDYTEFLSQQPNWFQKVSCWAHEQCEDIIILGSSIRQQFELNKDVAGKLRVIPYGISLSSTEKKYIESSISLLFLSNLIHTKGYWDVLKAIDILVNMWQYRNLTCDFCGSFMTNSDDPTNITSEQAKLNFDNFVEKRNLQNFVSFHGPVVDEKKKKFLKKAHVLLLPTYYNTEGQPISILEAMAHGQVVISTAFRAIPDMVHDQKTGFLLPPCNANAIAEKIKWLIDNPSQYSEMSQRALEHVKSNFSMQLHLKKIEAIFFEYESYHHNSSV